LGFSLSIKHEYVGIKQKSLDTTFNNALIGARIFNLKSNNSIVYLVDAKYGIAGFNLGSYYINASIKKYFPDSTSFLNLYSELIEQRADFINNLYISNHFCWENNFDKIVSKKIELSYFSKKLRTIIGTNLSIESNVVYFDNYATPRQYNGTIPVFSAFIKNKLSFKNLHLSTNFVYQYVPDSMVVRLPEFVLKNSLYYESSLFKRALLLQVGIDCYYNSQYYSNRYMPATSQFYLQDNRKYGNYPLFNFFVNVKIKDVRLFFKVEHLNDGFMKSNYILTPNYPMAGRAFKLGVSWRFFD
jgi:hypothetical protein